MATNDKNFLVSVAHILCVDNYKVSEKVIIKELNLYEALFI